VIEEERHSVLFQIELLLNAFAPLPRDPLPDSFHNEHGSDEFEWVLMAGLLKNVRRESFTSYVFLAGLDCVQVASRSHIVAFEHFKIPVFVTRMCNEGAADRKMVRSYAGSCSCNPSRPID